MVCFYKMHFHSPDYSILFLPKKIINTLSSSIISIFILCMPIAGFAQWAISKDTQMPSEKSTQIAYTTNPDGYKLEIFMDKEQMIHSRFIIKTGMLKLSSETCPTYQIDNGMAINNSINGNSCISNSQWVDYIIGNLQNRTVNSSIPSSLMDGNTLSFRFRLESGDYRETKFSLSGSKRSIVSVIGEQVLVKPQP